MSVFLACVCFKFLGGFKKRDLTIKRPNKGSNPGNFKLLILSNTHTTLYFLFFYSNNMDKLFVV